MRARRHVDKIEERIKYESESASRRKKGLELEDYGVASYKARYKEIISKCCKAPVKAKKQIIAPTPWSIRKGHWFICEKCNKECAVISAKKEVLKAKEKT